MNNLIRLGALNIDNKYVLPNDASKNDKYKCPDCAEKVYLKTGSIKKYHFSHYPSSNCSFYKKNNNSYTIHNHCQHLLKKIFDTKLNFEIISTCCSCEFKKNKKILTKDCEMYIEYEYIYKDSKKKIDCAIIKDNEPIEFIEVYNTHRTKDEDRPFFIEISVENILEVYDNTLNDCYYFNDIKYYECNNCILNKNKRIEEHNRKIKLQQEKDLRHIYWMQKQAQKRIYERKLEEEKQYYIELDNIKNKKIQEGKINYGLSKWLPVKSEVKSEVKPEIKKEFECYIEYSKGIQPITNFFNKLIKY